jgi:hypothetical protein
VMVVQVRDVRKGLRRHCRKREGLLRKWSS